MIKIISHDIVNDIAITQTAEFGLAVRFGLQITRAADIQGALSIFQEHQRHAIEYLGLAQ